MESLQKKEFQRETADSLKILMDAIEKANNQKEKALLGTLYILLENFSQSEVKEPAQEEELKNIRTLLSSVRADIFSFNLLREHLITYVKNLSPQEFQKIKQRIIVTIDALSKDEFSVFTDFLSGVENAGSTVLGVFYKKGQKGVVLEKLEGYTSQKDFVEGLLGRSGLTDLKEVEGKLKNAIRLLNLMIQNKEKQKK